MVNLSYLKKAIMDEDNLTLREMEQIFNVSNEELLESIKELLLDDKNDDNLYRRLIERGDIIYGRLSINRDNKGIVNFGNKKYYIHEDDIKDALDNDTVILEVKDDDKNNAKVKMVVDRNNGLLVVNYTNKELSPLYAPFGNEIILYEDDMAKIKDDDRLLLKIDKSVGNKTYCHVQTIIGHKDDLALDENTVALENKFHIKFPTRIEKELEEIPTEVKEEEVKGRVDLRGKNSFTIDDEDTQDMDDALFVEDLPNGNICVGIPISHVSYYVKRNGAIYNEAVERGTSLYLGKHSLPMFPRKLCNVIGSLNPNVDRLTRTVLVEFDKNCNIVDYKIVPSVIRSRKKMNYYDVNNIITRDIVKEDYIPFAEDIKKLYFISQALEKRKQMRGALDFKSQETKIIFDNKMKPIGFHELENMEARKIIENFALLANELYDIDAKKRNVKNINRVETTPDGLKVNEMIRWINSTGLNIEEIENIENPREISRVLEAIKNDDRYSAFSGLLLRGMQKAKYSTLELGHYGLALKEYAQFTSPIRRLGDFINHSIYDDLDKGINPDFSSNELAGLAKQASYMELRSDKATSDINKIYMATYMKDYIGESFEGRIIDIGSYGALVKTDSQVIGRVDLKDVLYGKYKYNKEEGSLYEKENGNSYRIGDKVKITVKDANKEKRTIDFNIVEKIEDKKLIKKSNH